MSLNFVINQKKSHRETWKDTHVCTHIFFQLTSSKTYGLRLFLKLPQLTFRILACMSTEMTEKTQPSIVSSWGSPSLLPMSSLTLQCLRCYFSKSGCLLLFTGIFSSMRKMPYFMRVPFLHLHFTLPHQTACLRFYFCPGSGCCTPDCWILRVSVSWASSPASPLLG